jgi:GT2 family glycosyltransferase
MKRIMQAQHSSTEWIACIDSDVVIYPDWWKEVSTYIGAGNIVSVSGYLESDYRRIFPEYEDFTKFCASFRSFFTKRIGAFSNILIRRDLLLRCEEDLRYIHAGEDTVIGKRIREMGYAYKVIRKPLGFHWHKDPVEHHIMAYSRAGQSAGMHATSITRSGKMFRFLALTYLQLLLFSIRQKKISIRLWHFVTLLSTLYVDGLLNMNSLNQPVSERIRKLIG